MINKINALRTNNKFLDDTKYVIVNNLIQHYKKNNKNVSFSLHNEGTLSICGTLKVNNLIFFVKTHFPNDYYRTVLEREAFFLSTLYGSKFNVETVKLNNELFNQTYLVTPKLTPLKKELPYQNIIRIIEDYQNLFANHIFSDEIFKNMFTICDYYKLAIDALEKLLTQGELSKPTADKIFIILRKNEYLFSQKSIQSYILCHGDLSSKNIMFYEPLNFPVIIDWEDAFWGVKNYDFCNYLTFFNRRHLLMQSPILFTTISEPQCLLLVIVIIKCYQDFMTKRYLTNSISNEERIVEILNLYN